MATAKVNGAELYYEEAGSGPPIILSPGGLQGVASSYANVMDALSQEHRVIVYDRRFGGQSRSPMVVQTWDMVCDDVFGLMDALGIEQSILGGGSFGAAISFGCAYRRPERVRAIFPSNIAGGVICDGYLTCKLYKSMEVAAAESIGAGDRCLRCRRPFRSHSARRSPRPTRSTAKNWKPWRPRSSSRLCGTLPRHCSEDRSRLWAAPRKCCGASVSRP